MSHKDGTIKLYNNQLHNESSEFMKLVLKRAIVKLKNNTPPKKVEDWVVSLEKLWRKFLT